MNDIEIPNDDERIQKKERQVEKKERRIQSNAQETAGVSSSSLLINQNNVSLFKPRRCFIQTQQNQCLF